MSPRPNIAEAAVAAPPAIAPPSAAEAAEGLYVHVPFCVRKCEYCDFYSLALAPGRAAPDAERYLAALARELASLPAGFRPRTVFIGGGTPTELALDDLGRLLDLVRGRVDLGRVEEWTVEANPGTLDRAKAEALRAAGVDRVSLGVQSFEPRNLRFLGRIHTGEEAERGFHLLREVGFRNVNLDFIAAIPGSSGEVLRRDLERAIGLGPEHLSCYGLIFEEGTPLERLRQKGLVRPVPDEDEAAQYELARDLLTAHGYEQYEISNYARRDPGRDLRCRHNLTYWGPGEFHGVGPGAHGHIGRARFGNVRNLERWCAAWLGEPGTPSAPGGAAGESEPPRDRPASPPDPGAARAFHERLDGPDWAREALVMSLRRRDGVAAAAFRAATGFDIEALAGPALRRMEGLGMVEAAADGGWRLSERGLLVSDAVFAELL